MEQVIVGWGILFFIIMLLFVIWRVSVKQEMQFRCSETMPCYDCQKPIPFAYGSTETIARCTACYKKHFDDFQARMLPTHTCSLCGQFAARANDAMCWHCRTVNTTMPLAVQSPRYIDFPRYKNPYEFARTMSGYPEQKPLPVVPPTRLYSLESDVMEEE